MFALVRTLNIMVKRFTGGKQEVFFGTIPHVPLWLLQGEKDVNTACCVICSSVSEALVCFFWPCRALSWEPDSLVTHKQGLFQVALYRQSVGGICDRTVVNISLFCPRWRPIGTRLAPHRTWMRILKTSLWNVNMRLNSPKIQLQLSKLKGRHHAGLRNHNAWLLLKYIQSFQSPRQSQVCLQSWDYYFFVQIAFFHPRRLEIWLPSDELRRL